MKRIYKIARSTAWIFALVMLTFVASQAMAESSICETVKDKKVSESAEQETQDAVMKCIADGYDPPLNWRVRGGQGAGYSGGISGGIMSMAKCPPDLDKPCPSYGAAAASDAADYAADSDGDGISNATDSDGNGNEVPDRFEQDSDGDGIVDTNDSDDDGDNILDGEDTDQDGDGIPNEEEADTDGDGIIDDLDTDDDGNGKPDYEEEAGGGDYSCEGSGEKVKVPSETGGAELLCGGGIRISYPMFTIAPDATYYAVPSGVHAMNIYRKTQNGYVLHKTLNDLPLLIEGEVPVETVEDPENPTPNVIDSGNVSGIPEMEYTPEGIETVPPQVATRPGSVVPAIANQFIALSENSRYLAVAYTNTKLFTLYRKSGSTFNKVSDAAPLPADFGLLRVSSKTGSQCKALTVTAYAPCNDKFLTVNKDYPTFLLPPESTAYPFTKGHGDHMLFEIPARHTEGAVVVVPTDTKLDIGAGAGPFYLVNGGSYYPPGHTEGERTKIKPYSFVSVDANSNLTIRPQTGGGSTVAFTPGAPVTIYVDDGSVHVPAKTLLPAKAKSNIATPTRISEDDIEKPQDKTAQ